MDSFTIQITGIKELLNKLDQATKESVIKDSLNTGAALLVSWSKDKRLSGPRPEFLDVRSGRLRSSITFTPTVKEGNVYSSRIGTNVEYAAIHEFGGKIQRYARTSLRVQNRRTTDSFVNIAGYGKENVGGKGRFKKGTTAGHGFTYGNYVINIPARPFLTPALADEGNKKDILNTLTMNINEALAQ